MIARLARTVLFLEILAAALIGAAAVAWLHVDSWSLATLLGLSIVLLVRLSITANSFIVAWQFRDPTPADQGLTSIQTCRLFFSEFRATLWSTSWSMPFLSFQQRRAAHPNGLPVLLIHGWGCNSGYWHAMSRALMRAHISHRAVDLEPILASIDSYVAAIRDAVETLCKENGCTRIVIVGHSMGGLAARAYLRDHGHACVAKLVTLGTPHHGTALANFGSGVNNGQMQWHGNAHGDVQSGTPSAWLNALNSGEHAAIRERIVSIYSHHDNIIAPQTSSHLEGARNIAFQNIGHVALALHPAIQAQVIAEIRNASMPIAGIESAH